MGKKCPNAADPPCSVYKYSDPISVEQNSGYCSACRKKNPFFREEQKKIDKAQFELWQKDGADKKKAAGSTAEQGNELKGETKKEAVKKGGKRKRDDEGSPVREGGAKRGPGRKVVDGKKPRGRQPGAMPKPANKPAETAAVTDDDEVESEVVEREKSFIVDDGSDDDGEKNYVPQSSRTTEGRSDRATSDIDEDGQSDTSVLDDSRAPASDPHDSDLTDTASPGSREENGGNSDDEYPGSDEDPGSDENPESDEKLGSENKGDPEVEDGRDRGSDNGGDTIVNTSPRSEPDAAPAAVPAPAPASIPSATLPVQQQPAAGWRCTAITKKGTWCKRSKDQGRDQCFQH